jgi:hypothetical protein
MVQTNNIGAHLRVRPGLEQARTLLGLAMRSSGGVSRQTRRGRALASCEA